MVLQLTQCTAAKPEKRAIAKILEVHASLAPIAAAEQVDFLLEGSEIEIDFAEESLSTAYRQLRKNDVEYKIVDPI